MRLLSVSELGEYLTDVLAVDPVLTDVWVEGEISNRSSPSSGHVYFTLKDGNGQISCVLFRTYSNRIGVPLLNGQAALVHGRVSFWQSGGRLQLYADMVQPVGLGKLQLEFEALKARLEEEGLFDPARKRPLPRFPRSIGIVTSAHGAALQDILNVLGRRYPVAELYLATTPVQGDGAGRKIAAAIQRVCRTTDAEVIIVARGGGSIEELWAFNEECVARAIFAASVPVISGVGHETDFTIADFVADLRAPTPSAAAELVTPNIAELRSELDSIQLYLRETLHRHLELLQDELGYAVSRLRAASPARTVERHRELLHSQDQAARTRLRHLIQLRQGDVLGQRMKLGALAPHAVLSRGYASVTNSRGGPVRSVTDLEPGETVTAHFADGDALAEVLSAGRAGTVRP